MRSVPGPLRRSRWLRPVFALLAVIQLATGGWAVVAPRSWYDRYPGFGRAWVEPTGPYNAHLAVDAGAGFLAVGAALAVAVVWFERPVIRTAAVVLLVHSVPHFAFHATHHVHRFSTFDTLAGEWSLLLGIVVAVAALVATSRRRRRPPDRQVS